MRPVVYLHIGTMKTGTTYVQRVVTHHREALEAAGLFFACNSWPRQVRATQDLLQLDQHDPQIAALSSHAWAELVADLRTPRAAPGSRNLVSMEFLSFARPPAVERVARDLDGVDWHVVLTVRDATSVIPAQWQTSITSGAVHTWEEFQRGVRQSGGRLWMARALRDSGVREFRRTQDVQRMLEVWGKHVPADRLHVVLVPRAAGDPHELWRRFAGAIGVDPGAVAAQEGRSNVSLGYASAELVRRLNVVFDGQVLPWDYNSTVKTPFGSRILGARRGEERRPALDDATAAFARDWNVRTAAAIRASGAQVVGDLDADLPVRASGSAAPVPAPSDDEVLGAARDAHAGLVRLIEKRRGKVARRLGATRPEPLPVPSPQWVTRPGGGATDLNRAVADVADLLRTAMRLRRDMYDLRDA